MIRDVLLARGTPYFCRPGFGGRGVLRFLEGAKIKITPLVGLLWPLAFGSALVVPSEMVFGCCRRALGADRLRAAVGCEGCQGESRRARCTARSASSKYRGNCCLAAGRISPGQHRVRAGRNPGPFPGGGTQLCPRSSPGAPEGGGSLPAPSPVAVGHGMARPPVWPLWALCLGRASKPQGNLGGKHVVLGFGC